MDKTGPRLPLSAVVSKNIALTLLCVVEIARAGPSVRTASGDLTDKLGISSRGLEADLQKLVKAGIVRGKRGPQGGYILDRPATYISCGDVARAILGPRKSDGGKRSIDRAIYRSLSAALVAYEAALDAITIADLVEQSRLDEQMELPDAHAS